MAVPFLTSITLNKNEVQNFKVFNLGTDPNDLTSDDKGYFWLNTDVLKLRYWSGTAVRDLLDTSSSISGSQISGNITGNAANVTGIVAVANGGTGTSTGSITGTGALTFTSGGANNNLNLNPSGTGAVVSSGSISAPDVSTGTFTATGLALFTGTTTAISATDGPSIFKTVNTSTITGRVANADITITPDGTGNVSVANKKIINLAEPTNAQDAATKAYVDAKAQGLDIKDSCVAATTDVLPSYVATGAPNTAGAYLEASANGNFPSEFSFIGTPVVGNRVLVKNETSTLAKWNGIYTITALGGVASKWKITRASDFDVGTATPGSFVFVEEGATYKGTGWVMNQTGTITINSTAITWTQFSGAGTYSANRGLVLNSTTNAFNFAQDSDYTTGQIPYASSATAIGFKTVTGTGSVVLATGPSVTGLLSDTINVGSGTLVANLASYTGKVGIGTVTPGYPLHLLGEFGLEETSAGVGSKLSLLGDATKYNFRLGKQLSASNTFEITPSTAVGGTTFTNPVYTVTYNGIHSWRDGAGGTRMTLDGTGLGIGTSPSYKLDVNGTGRLRYVSGTGAGFYCDSQNNALRYFIGSVSGSESFGIYDGVGAAYRLTIDSSGNVGIGVSPSYLLDVVTTGPYNIVARIKSGAGTNFRFDTTRNFSGVNRNFIIGIDEHVEGAFSIAPSTALGGGTFTNPVYVVTASGTHSWRDGAGGTLATLNSTGLGIGVSPSVKLHVNGEIRSSSDISNSSNVTFYSYNGSSAGTVSSGIQLVGSSQEFRVYTASVQRLTISSTGAATFTGTVTAKSTGTGTGQVGVKWTSALAASGTGSTVTLTHNLGSSDLVATLRQISTKKVVYADITFNDDNNVNITFASSQTLSDFQITLIG